jgi:hypothetical protein
MPSNPYVLKCGGVPEHFNLPWLESARREPSLFRWTDYPGGTGEMCDAMRDGSLDIAVMLTEGAVKNILHGLDARIMCFFTDTSLVWGVHTGFASTAQHADQLQGFPFAISRYTSGSHLMAYLYARQQLWPSSLLRFNVVGSLEGARRSLAENPNQIFLWEKHSTHHLVQSGEFRKLDECPTPWPAVVVVASNSVLQEYPLKVEDLMYRIKATSTELNLSEHTAPKIAAAYGISEISARNWLQENRWNTSPHPDLSPLKRVVLMLRDLGIIDDPMMSKADGALF